MSPSTGIPEIPNSDEQEIIDPYFQDPQVMHFTGGPLDGQTRRMEVYVAIIPVKHSITGRIKAHYTNVNAIAGITEDLKQIGHVHYVYYEDGKRVK